MSLGGAAKKFLPSRTGFDPSAFASLEAKCTKETKVGQVANFAIWVAFTFFLTLKQLKLNLQMRLKGIKPFTPRMDFKPESESFGTEHLKRHRQPRVLVFSKTGMEWELGSRTSSFRVFLFDKSSAELASPDSFSLFHCAWKPAFAELTLILCPLPLRQLEQLVRSAAYAGTKILADRSAMSEAATDFESLERCWKALAGWQQRFPETLELLPQEWSNSRILNEIFPAQEAGNVSFSAAPYSAKTQQTVGFSLEPSEKLSCLLGQTNATDHAPNHLTIQLDNMPVDNQWRPKFLESTSQWISISDSLNIDPAIQIGSAFQLGSEPKHIFSDVVDRNRKKRIAIVNVYFEPVSFGGATVVAEELARHFAIRSDCEIVVFSGNEDGGLRNFEVGRKTLSHGIELYSVRLPRDISAIETWKNLRMQQVFEEFLKVTSPDLVHFHCVQMLGANLLDVTARTNIPFAVTLHDAWWLCDLQFRFNNETGERCKALACPPSACGVCGKDKLARAYRRRNLLRSLHCATALLAPSNFQLELYAANGIPRLKILSNENGVKSPIRPRQRSKRKNSLHLHFAFLGGPSKIKGYHTLIEAFLQLPQRIENYTLLLPDPDRKKGGNSDFGDLSKLAGRVRIVDPFSQSEIDSFFDDVDVLVVPSQWDEAFGLVLREALIRDVFVISSNRGGLPEAIEEGVNGLVFDADQQDSLVKKIEWCLNNRSTFVDFKNPHAKRVRTFEQQADELFNFLDGFLS